MTTNPQPFPADALEANRLGQLSPTQQRQWAQIARSRRKGIRGGAYVAAAIGVLLLVADGPASKALQRTIVGAASLAIAAAVLVASTRERLTADVRDDRVATAEGAILKRVVQSRYSSAHYFDIAGQRLRTGRTIAAAAPDAGVVRAYYLPRTRFVVSFEQLPDRPVSLSVDAARSIAGDVLNALRSRDTVELAEAEASAAALEHAFERTFAPSPGAAASPAAPIVRDQLIGSWRNVLVAVTFANDGTATLTLPGGTRRAGRWSIDARGRLISDATGDMAPVDARLEGDQLTIAFDGRQVTLTRTT